MRKVPLTVLILGFTLLGIAAGNAQSLKHCFNTNMWGGWWRPAGDKTVYIRTNNTRYYRIDLTRSCGTSTFPGAQLILRTRGGKTICSRLDFNLRINQGTTNFPQPCFVKSISEVPPSEVAALRNR